MIKELLNLFDPSLKETFQKRAYDPLPDRAKMNRRLNATKAKFLATEPAKGRKDFAIANNVVAWTPSTPSGATFFEDGTVYVPSERFAEAIDKTIQLVDGGEFDARLKGDQNAHVPDAPRSTRKPRQPGVGRSGKGWSEERRTAYAATIAARKAAQQL